MNLITIAKLIGLLWKVSKPVSERIIREAEYCKIMDELSRNPNLDDIVREACGVAARKGTGGRDPQGS